MRILLFAAVSFLATPFFAQMEYDAKILEYTGLKYACPGGGTPILKIINEGSVTMSGCVVETWKNGVLVNSFDWQLAVPAAQGDIRQPVLPDVSDVDPGDALEFRIISVNEVPDQEPEGNILEVVLDGVHATTSITGVTVKVETDDAPADLTWEIRNDLNQLVASGGPYEDAGAVIMEPVVLDPLSCYSFKALDSGRDVLSGARIQVLGGPNTLLSVEGPALQAGDKLGLSTGNGEACSHPLTMELHTDGAPDETSWEIIDQDNGAIVCSGAGNYEADAYVTENCCLPMGCYRLRVLDAVGDGMTTGGYVLRTGDSMQRIIDDRDNFSDGGISAISGDQGFCLPLGMDKPIFSSCDKLDWIGNRFIVASENAAVSAQWDVTPPIVQPTNSGYEFWFYDPNGSYSYRRFRSHATSDGFGTGATRACHFRINGWANNMLGPHLPANKLLNVRIRGRVAGANLEFGPACQFRIDPVLAACPRVKLQDNPASNDLSCGVSRTFGGPNSMANRITATPPQPVPVVASTSVRYQFRFRIPGEDICIVRPPQISPTLHLNWSTGQLLQCNRPYEVDVRVSLDGGTTWCFDAADPFCAEPVTLWGKVCTLNITNSVFCPSEFSGPADDLSPSGVGQFTLYPNPVQGDRIFLSLTQLDPSVDRAYIEVFDMTGKRVMTGSFTVSAGSATTTLDLPATMTNGLYLVHLKAGGQVFSGRLALQR